MRKRADVRSQSNRHTGCELFAKFLRMQVEQFLFALRSVRSHSVGGEVFRDGKRGYREYVLLPHQPHGLIAELECVINGHDPSLRRIQRPGSPVACTATRLPTRAASWTAALSSASVY